MKKKFIVLTLLAALIVIGCSQRSAEFPEEAYYASNLRAMGGMDYAYDDGRSQAMHFTLLESEVYYHDSLEFNESASITNTERKLVKTANLRIRAENLETADASITTLLRKYNAYSASTSIEENSRYYSLRVPSQQYDVFLEEMEGIGRMINRYENTEDVTLRYYDLESRLESRKELLNTFQAYLRRANNMEEILSVEYRIAELQREIEFTGTQLRNLGNQVDYANIDLYLLGPVTSASNQNITFAERIKQLFSGFSNFLYTVAITLLGIVIYGIPLLLLIALLFWLFFGRIGLIKKLWRLITTGKITKNS